MPHEKSAEELELQLAHKIRKIHDRMLSGSEHERNVARDRLQELLSKYKKSWNDVARLIALAIADDGARSSQRSSGDDEPTQSDGPIPSPFELVDWVSRRFLYLEEHQHTAFALWILHAHVFRSFSHSPRLALLSPVRGCGKSTALDVCAKLCPRARKFGNITTAVLPRLIERDQPTLLLDEADNFDFQTDPALGSILNDGFYEGGRKALVSNQEVVSFSVFAPIAFGAIGKLPLPLMSRSILINMHRAPRTAKIERLDFKNPVLMADLDVIYRQVFDWAQRVRLNLNTDPQMPDGFFGRTGDRWRALFAIADSVGCGDRAREAARVLNGEHQDEDLKVTLLSDIRTAFGALADDQLTSDMLLQSLLTLGDEHWAEFRGENNDQAPKPLTRPTLAKLLSPFGIRTRTIWPRNRSAGSKSQRGYHKSQFERAWANYCDGTNTPTQSSNIRRLTRP